MVATGRSAAIIVGVGAYGRAPEITPLLGAEADARRMNAALQSWGYRSDHIKLLLRHEATREGVLAAIRVWAARLSLRTTLKRLVVYFAGHGRRCIAATGDVSVLLPYDVLSDDIAGTGVALTEIVRAVVDRVKTEEIYAFFDACSLAIPTLDRSHSGPLPESDITRLMAPNCVYVVFGAGLGSAVEDKSRSSGMFTECLLTAIAKARNTEPTVSGLSRELRSAMSRLRVPPIGEVIQTTAPCWLLPEATESEADDERSPGVSEAYYVPRPAAIALVQDAVVRAKLKPLWIVGAPGSGKTVLGQMFRRVHSAIYLTTDISDAARSIWDRLVSDLISERPDLGLALGDGSLRLGNELHDLEGRFPGCVVVVDHLDRLSAEDTSELLEVAFRVRALQFIFISRRRPPLGRSLCVVTMPKLTNSEIAYFARRYAPGDRLRVLDLATASGRNPLRLRNFLGLRERSAAEQLRRSPRLRRDAQMVITCGGLRTVSVFCECTFSRTSSVELLIRSGLLVQRDDALQPHDQLASLLPTVEPSRDMLISSAAYWAAEVELAPWAREACIGYIRAVDKLGHVPDGHASAATRAAEWASRSRSLQFLELLGRATARSDSGELYTAALLATRALVRTNRYDVLMRIQRSKSVAMWSESAKVQLAIMRLEMHWWHGDFRKTIDGGFRLIRRRHGRQHEGAVRLQIGIGQFFEGEWRAAMSNVTLAEHRAVSDRNDEVLGWSRLIAGTILGIRGIDMKSADALLASAVRLLTALGDTVGAGIALGNWGEIQWKAGRLRTARETLGQALRFAESGGSSTNRLEILRNHLSVAVRDRSTSIIRKALERQVRDLLRDSRDRMETMQVMNTLATVSAYDGAMMEGRRLTEAAGRLTAGNVEYDIYTLGNECLMEMLAGSIKKADLQFARAMLLAQKGQNILAATQLLNDIHTVSKRVRARKGVARFLRTAAKSVNMMREQSLQGGDAAMKGRKVGLALVGNVQNEDLLLGDLRAAVKDIDGVRLSNAEPSRTKYGERLGILEVIATLVTSAAGYRLAVAIHAYAAKSRVSVRIKSDSGKSVIVKGTGDAASEVGRVIEALTHAKRGKRVRSRKKGDR